MLAVSGKTYVWQGLAPCMVKSVLAGLDEVAWQRLSAGFGSKGPRLFDWQCVALPSPPTQADWCRCLLVRRSLKTQALTAYLVFAPRETTLQRLVWVAGRRWCIEVCFESAKQEVGLDDYEVRSWQGWHRHVTLSMWALALLVAVRAAQVLSSGVEVPGKKVMLTVSLSGFRACPVLDTGASRGLVSPCVWARYVGCFGVWCCGCGAAWVRC